MEALFQDKHLVDQLHKDKFKVLIQELKVLILGLVAILQHNQVGL